MPLPFLLYSDRKGKIYRHPFLRMAVSSLGEIQAPLPRELIRLPRGSVFFYLPHRAPVGFNPRTKKLEVVRQVRGKEVFAVGAFLIPAYLRLYNPAVVVDKKQVLPLWAYTAAGFYGGRNYAAAVRVDPRVRQRPSFYAAGQVRPAARYFLRLYPRNRLYQHLSNCALNHNCLAAKNFFLRRWEAPLPTARFCNAKCVGCLSHQESDCVASHARINFRPSRREIEQVLAGHLREAREAIVSFGQGCEGEPLLEADLIAAAVSRVRSKMSRGTINVNTNGSLPVKVGLLCRAGVDSFRFSLNSVREEFYNRYFRPQGYKFAHVLDSIKTAKNYKKFVSVNLFIFPGFSDSREEINALIKFIRNTKIDMIQWRNLNIDPDYYLENVTGRSLNPQGVLTLRELVKKEFPHLKEGYFNLPKEQFF